jgi:uncharacterized membrane protein YtjA (UPF0391 family)
MALVVILLILAVISAFFGYGWIAVGFAGLAVFFFWVFLILFLIGAFFRLITGSWWGSKREIREVIREVHEEEHHDDHKV